ncbi:hypothetical protein Tco_1486291 [Tanacetum coccineum]
MYKGDRIIIRGTLLRKMVQQAMGEYRIELGMPMQDKMLLMQAQENGAVLDEEELLFLDGEQTNTFDADVDNQPIRDLALNEDNIFQAYECDALDSNLDDEPIAQSIYMANLSSAGPANLQPSPSNASILSEKFFIESTSADMGNSNVIPYEQYLTVNDVSVVPSSASSVPDDAYVLHDNYAYVPLEPLATELNIYKEEVAIYEQRVKFYLRKAKKAQPALYDSDELLKTHHVLITITSSEEDLELAKTTRMKMNEKMNDSVCVEKRVKIIPPNYSKGNFMATFTPQTQLTPGQVFRSNEIKEKKA